METGKRERKGKVRQLSFTIEIKSIIMVRDFNKVLSTSMDRKGNHSTNHRVLKEITNIMDTLEIVDIWRPKIPT